MSNVLNGNEIASGNTSYSQVYSVTHNGAGNRLPYMQKSFISFSYGGKFIEDFGLIAVNGNDKLERVLYGSFEDTTTDYIKVDGQIFWGTHIKNNALQLALSTDGMEQKQLDEFKNWFKPGIARELILSEHPNRAIMARVAEPPAMEMLPFEKRVNSVVSGTSYTTSTTVYKGNISLSLIMDDPTWYVKLNYMPAYVDKVTLEPFFPELPEEPSEETDLPDLEIEVNDDEFESWYNLDEQNNLPVQQDFYNEEHPNVVYSLNNEDMIKIMYEDNIPHQLSLTGNLFLGGNQLVKSESRVDVSNTGAPTRVGIITENSLGIAINSNSHGYLFYSGTAKSYPIIKFSISFPCNENESVYLNRYLEIPSNSYYKDDNKNYSYIALKLGNQRQEFRFTTPSILTGYNQAVSTIKNMKGQSTTDIINALREKVTEKYSRAWAVACVQDIGPLTTTDDGDLADIFENFQKFINPNVPATFIINSKTGEAVGTFSVKVKEENNTVDNAVYCEITENVGDMIRSDYLILEERNYLNTNGEIELNNCYEIISDLPLTNVLFLYENKYL